MNNIGAAPALHTSRERIPEHEITFHPHSFADPAGRLFWWQGQLYRGIRSEWAPVVKRLFGDGVVQRLVERGLLIETQPTPLKLDGYEMVVRHRTVPFVSYPEEWCPLMLKAAALVQLELLAELARCGFTLKDAHPWNVLFDAWKPVYVDFSSITPIDHDAAWSGYDQFYRFYLNPLTLMVHGQDRIARRLLPEIDGVSNSDVSKLARPPLSFRSMPTAISRASSGLRRSFAQFGRGRIAQELRSQKTYLASLKQLKREVEKITFSSANAKKSADNEGSNALLSPPNDWRERQRSLHRLLSDLRPTSVLDIDCGWYSKLAAGFGSSVVSFDPTSSRVTQLYCDVRDKKLSILPLVMDFTDPTPSRGLSSHWAISATQRFQCDLVMALSVVHWIVFQRHLNFEQIVGGLALFSKRWLIVEFLPSEPKELGKWQPHVTSSYTLDNFIDALRKPFRSVNIKPSYAKSHVILVCEK